MRPYPRGQLDIVAWHIWQHIFGVKISARCCRPAALFSLRLLPPNCRNRGSLLPPARVMSAEVTMALRSRWPSVHPTTDAAVGCWFFTLPVLIILLLQMPQLQVSTHTRTLSLNHTLFLYQPAHTHSRHALSLSFSSLSLSLSRSLARLLALSLTHTCTQTVSLAHPLTYSFN